MKQAAVIFWSQTGNTQRMAEAIQEGISSKGIACELLDVSAVDAQQALEYEYLALGCPAMGAEVLEESEFEPFFTQLEGQLGGHKVALFGSYGWGDGQWIHDWQERTDNAGAYIVNGEGLKVHETPTDEDLDACKALGKALAN